MTIENEMEEFEKYDKMLQVEFIEFIGRSAELIFTGNQPLVQKIQRLLHTLFNFYFNQSCIIPEEDENNDSESDDQDFLVD